ncbi:BZ3500_MvSof-1268-A1-R1_Chr8-1g09948 [Microbotryum saponariae]|uniref:Endonuclease n=1 Tax=Microbotryum saponariae TaxID=289078 RepID=A0A2X0KSV1_9BASI|nr:BZ3500_MvSof-1268-A1-R1_Chr8-1g09948 [Microbotryum saponariae]SDA08234.1 BZ3501_MvSof-1269-A2-R1_Chr8-1g09671 [Microbotryum saponariae]
MSSLLNLSLAAVAGLAIGAGATVALLPPPKPPVQAKNDQPSRTNGIAPLAHGSSPVPGPPGSAAIPGVELYHGLLTGTELAKRNLTIGQIGPISDFLVRKAYTTAYDRRLRIPSWTAEHLTAASLKGSGNRQDVSFEEDRDIPDKFRAHLLDYFKSGYDRGHMVPAADAKQDQEAMKETFLLSNIAPQVGEGFNRNYWAYLEAFCRNLTSSFEDVHVFTVPLFLPRRSPDGKWRVTYEMIAAANSAPTIAVPTHFAKVLLTSRPPRSGISMALTTSPDRLAEKEWAIGAFVLPNEVIPDEARLETFIVPDPMILEWLCSPVDAVESSSGLTLIPDELKRLASPLCSTVKCEVIVRRFDDAQKKLGGDRPKPRRRETM